jgi:hypothetical protein
MSGTATAVRKGNPHSHADLTPAHLLVILNCLQLFTYLQCITGAIHMLQSFRNKCILADNMNAKHPFWNSAVSNPSGQNLFQLYDVNDFEILVSLCPTHYSPAGNGGMLDTVVNKNTRLSNTIVSDIMDSDHLPIIFYIMDHVRTTKLLKQLTKLTNWDRFKSLATDLISPRTEINSGIEANKAACNFTASTASAYR